MPADGPTQKQVQDWLRAYGAAWVDCDTGAVIELFASDATYREDAFIPPLCGRTAIANYWDSRVVAHQSDISFAPEIWLLEGDMAVVHWRASFFWRPIGARVELDGIMRLLFVSGPQGQLLCKRFEEWIEIRDPAQLEVASPVTAAEPV